MARCASWPPPAGTRRTARRALGRAARRRGRARLDRAGQGEAGIGKTSLVRAFVGRRAGAAARRPACDDLVTPRTLGPLQDAAPDGGPLARPWVRAQVFGGADGRARAERPTVLVIEDAHWADDATLDVLGYAARRVGSLAALLVLTVRDEALSAGHPLHRLLGRAGRRAGAPAGALAALARGGGRLVNGTGRDADAVLRSRAGTRSSSPRRSPRRRTRCRPASRTRCWRGCAAALAGLPRGGGAAVGGAVGASHATLLGRHSRARWPRPSRRGSSRRATAASASGTSSPGGRSSSRCPSCGGGCSTRTVVGALRAARGSPIARGCSTMRRGAGDVGTLLAEGPAAAREAARAGSHRQALAHFEAVIAHAALLDAARAGGPVPTTTGGSSTTRHGSSTAVRRGARGAAALRGAWRRAGAGAVPGAAVAAALMAGATDEAARPRRSAR